MLGPDFLDLPTRATKPRGIGISHVLDRGIPLAQAADLLAMSEPYIDVWKLGWGISYLDPTLPGKLELLARHGVLASPGGTLLEIAWAQGRVTEFLDWARGCGFPCVEVSAGTVAMDRAAKQDLIAEAARHFIVLAEVGPKDPGVQLTPAEWAQAPASRSSASDRAHCAGVRCTPGSFGPTSASTMKCRAASAISSCLAAWSMATVPAETSTHGNPQPRAQSRNSIARSCAQAISSSVPPGEASTPCSASNSSVPGRVGSR